MRFTTIIGAVAAALWAISPGAASAAGADTATSSRGRVDAMAIMVERQLNQVADEHFHEGEYNHAVAIDRMMVALVPADMEAYSNAGYLLWSLGKESDAVGIYKQGIRDNPNTFYMYDELGQHFMLTRHWSDAVPWLEKAASFPDVISNTLHSLAKAYERTGHLDKALTTWQRAVRVNHDPHLLGAEKRNLARVQRLVEQQRGGRG